MCVEGMWRLTNKLCLISYNLRSCWNPWRNQIVNKISVFSFSHLTPSIKINFDNFCSFFLIFFFGSLIHSCETVCHLILFFLPAFSFNCFTHECSLSVLHSIWYVMLKEITFVQIQTRRLFSSYSLTFFYLFCFHKFGNGIIGGIFKVWLLSNYSKNFKGISAPSYFFH